MVERGQIVEEGVSVGGRRAIALLERDDELMRVGRVLAGACAGEGAAVMVEGPSGIGKTSVLGAARRLAAAAGMRVLAGRATEVEREVAWGVVRELFVGHLAARTGP